MAETFFITGATGNIGGRLVQELLNDKSVRLFLLITGDSLIHAQQKGQALLDFWQIDNLISRQRVEIIHGDMTKKRFCLSIEAFEKLSQQITQIVHCAANLKLNMTLAQAQISILEGTKNTVDLAKQCQKSGIFKRYHYISTLEISGKFKGIFREEFLPKQGYGFLNTYEEAKAQAEIFLQEEHRRGLPLTIYRPSMVVGDSQTGQIKNFQSFYYLLRDMVLVPKAPILPVDAKFRVEISPVDFIAHFIMAVSKSGDETNGKIYHLTNGGPDYLTSLPEFIMQSRQVLLSYIDRPTLKVIFIPPFLIFWFLSFVRLFTFGKFRKEINAHLIFLRFLLLDVIFDNTQMRNFAEENNIQIPSLSESLVPLYKYYARFLGDRSRDVG